MYYLEAVFAVGGCNSTGTSTGRYRRNTNLHTRIHPKLASQLIDQRDLSRKHGRHWEKQPRRKWLQLRTPLYCCIMCNCQSSGQRIEPSRRKAIRIGFEHFWNRCLIYPAGSFPNTYTSLFRIRYASIGVSLWKIFQFHFWISLRNLGFQSRSFAKPTCQSYSSAWHPQVAFYELKKSEMRQCLITYNFKVTCQKGIRFTGTRKIHIM